MTSAPIQDRIEREAHRIMADEYLGTVNADALVDWATKVLEVGLDGYNIRMLAASDRSASWFELEDFFRHSLEELGIAWPDRETALWNRAVDLACQLQEGHAEHVEGIVGLADLARQLGYPDALMEFYCLEDDLELKYGPSAIDMEAWKRAVSAAVDQFLKQTEGT